MLHAVLHTVRTQIEAEITSMSLSSSEDRVFSSSESKRQQLKFSRCSSVSYTVFTALVTGSHVFVYPLFQVMNELIVLVSLD